MFEYFKGYKLQINKAFLSNMGYSNKQRIIDIQDALVVEAQISNALYRYYYIKSGQLVFTTDENKVGTLSIYADEISDTTLVLPRIITSNDFTSTASGSWSGITISFRFLKETNQDLPIINTNSNELYTGSYNSIEYNDNQVVTQYNEMNYHGDLVIPMVDFVNQFIFDAEIFDRTMYGGIIKLTIEGYNFQSGTPLEIDITNLCDVSDNGLFVPFLLPLTSAGSSSRGRAKLTVSSMPLIDIDIYAHNLADYKLAIPEGDAVEDGLVGTIKYSQSIDLTFLVNSGYHFNKISPDNIMSDINKNLYSSYEVSYFDMGGRYFIVRINGVKGQLDFSYLPRSITQIEAQPTLTTNLHGVSIDYPLSPKWGLQFMANLTADTTGKMVDLSSLKVIMNNENITNSVISQNNDGSVIILIPEVTNNISITAYEDDMYSLNIISKESTPLIKDTITSINGKFNIKIETTQPVNETQVNIKIYSNDILIGNHVVTIGSNKYFNGFAFNDSIILLPNIHIKNFDIKKYISTKSLTLLPVVIDIRDVENFEMDLYKLTGEKTIVNKINDIILIDNISGTLRPGCDIINPVIIIEYAKIPDFNYIYIPNFKRYYFVNNIQIQSKNIYIISLHVDVLFSFKDGIKSNTAIVARNEFDFNPNVEDIERPVQKNDTFEIIDIKTTDYGLPYLFKEDTNNISDMCILVDVIRGD